MRFAILIIALFILMGCNHTSPVTCAAIKNGKFYFHSAAKATKMPFEMQDSICIHITNEPGKMDTSNIEWQGDCEFMIKGRTPAEPKDSDKIKVALPVDMKILECNKRFFVLQTSYSDGEFLHHNNDTLWVDE